MTFSNSSNAPEYVDDEPVIDTSEQCPLESTRILCDPPSVSFNTNYSLTLMDLPSVRFESDFQPAPDNGHAREFETAFCRDFSCCGLRLVDMHDLLQHYEECHVRFEDDVDDMFDDSEFFDEDGWSDSDTPCPSPFPTSSSSSSPFEFAAGPGSDSGSTPNMSAFSSPSLTTATTTAAATTQHARANQNSFFSSPFADQTPRPSPFSLFHPSNSTDDLPLTFNNSIHPSSLQAFSASFAPSKRKVSPTDVYFEEEVEMETEESDFSEDSSAFSNTILRTRTPSTSSSSSTRSRTSLHLAKRQALGRGRSSSSLPWTQIQVTENAGSFGKVESMENYAGLDQPSLDILDINLNLFSGMTTTQGPGLFDVDIRHRDEVVSLLEDIGKASSNSDRPYRCAISGCDKAYKNPNGLKYHNQHGHSSGDDAPETKPYVCTFLDCGRRYKNLNGLKYHVEHCHPNLIGALRAHHSGLTSSPYLFGPYSSHALTIEAALAAIESPMMLAATNALLTHTSTSDKAKEKETTSRRSRTRSTTPATAPGFGPGPGLGPEIGALQMLMGMKASSGLSPPIPSGLAHGLPVEGGSASAGPGGGPATLGPLRLRPHLHPSSSDCR